MLSVALKLLAMTSMRSELGRIEMNKLFQSRKELNLRIRETLEETCQTWGITCDRYEILKIEPPVEVKKSMQLQAEAERVRRKDIILSEAKKLSDINIAEGRKQAQILRAQGHAEALEIKAIKEKDGLKLIAHTIMNGGNRGIRALDYILKRKYYDEYANILKNASVTVLPESESGSGGNSDILGAISLMMSHMKQQERHQPEDSHQNQTQAQADSQSARSKSTVKAEKPKQAAHKDNQGSQHAGRHAQKQDTTEDWSSMAFFNNPTLDQTTDRRR
jgi:SPFH domain / Band 7 family